MRLDRFESFKMNTILSNAGYFDMELNKLELEAISASKRTMRRNIKEY